MARPSDQLDELDICDFAQEFLRRNRLYRKQYDVLVHGSGIDTRSAAARRMARPWGLEFPVRPGAISCT